MAGLRRRTLQQPFAGEAPGRLKGAHIGVEKPPDDPPRPAPRPLRNRTEAAKEGDEVIDTGCDPEEEQKSQIRSMHKETGGAGGWQGRMGGHDTGVFSGEKLNHRVGSSRKRDSTCKTS